MGFSGSEGSGYSVCSYAEGLIKTIESQDAQSSNLLTDATRLIGIRPVVASAMFDESAAVDQLAQANRNRLRVCGKCSTLTGMVVNAAGVTCPNGGEIRRRASDIPCPAAIGLLASAAILEKGTVDRSKTATELSARFGDEKPELDAAEKFIDESKKGLRAAGAQRAKVAKCSGCDSTGIRIHGRPCQNQDPT